MPITVDVAAPAAWVYVINHNSPAPTNSIGLSRSWTCPTISTQREYDYNVPCRFTLSDTGKYQVCISYGPYVHEYRYYGFRVDWNNDHYVNSQDYFDFMNAFFNNTADFNRDGQINSQDYFDFLDEFFHYG